MRLEVNFLGPPEDPKKRRLFFFLKLFAGLTLMIGLFGALLSTNIISENRLLESLTQIPLLSRVRQLIRSADRSLIGQDDDRVNILLLGMGGAKHEGPYLTDTIILASIKPSTGQVAMISIPRDLAAPIPGRGWSKINSANAFGEEKAAGAGAELTRATLQDLLNLPIQYYLRIDFGGFRKLIDDLGGLDVYVERDFIDSAFPTGENGEVNTVSFRKGWQHFDGTRALEFARSRHGTNGEGSDFARAARQQKILSAIKERILSLGTLRSPAKISAVAQALENHIRMNFSPWELLTLARLANTWQTENIITRVLDDSPIGVLTATVGLDGAYLLLPKNNDWEMVRQLVRQIFDQPAARRAASPPRIEIQNGTSISGLAARQADRLAREGFRVVAYGNAPERTYSRTIIYDLTDGRHREELERLRAILKAEILAGAPSNNSFSSESANQENRPQANAAPAPDFLIILGLDNE